MKSFRVDLMTKVALLPRVRSSPILPELSRVHEGEACDWGRGLGSVGVLRREPCNTPKDVNGDEEDRKALTPPAYPARRAMWAGVQHREHEIAAKAVHPAGYGDTRSWRMSGHMREA